MKLDGLHAVSLLMLIRMHELLDVVDNSGIMEVLVCIADGVEPSDGCQPS